MLLLDTNVCIGILKGRPDLIQRLRSVAPDEIRICTVVRAELYYGARKSERVEHNLAGLRRFLAPLGSLPFDDRSAEEYGLIRADLERAGTPNRSERSDDRGDRPRSRLRPGYPQYA